MSPTPCRAPASAPAVHVLHPGAVVCVDSGERLETLLGSCVAIVLTDPRRTVGAMCHVVHSGPHARDRHDATHGRAALHQMFGQLRARAIHPQLCEAYVYGGGNMFPDMYSQLHVGQNNVDWALQALDDEGIRVLHHDTGGESYRRLSWTVGPEAPQVVCVPI